jgi:uncharacterized damage-inducible protein DinB
MELAALLLEVYGRVPPLVTEAVEGLGPDQLTWAPVEGANTIGWLTWHLARVEDIHVAELLDAEQLWSTGTWAADFGLEPDPENSGYGHDAADVARVRPGSADAITGYLAAVHARTQSFLEGLDASALDQIVDRRWDPPVTMGVRLVSIADDCLQHAGQAAYVRGLLTNQK